MKKLALILLLALAACAPGWATQYARPVEDNTSNAWLISSLPCGPGDYHPCIGDNNDGTMVGEDSSTPVQNNFDLNAATDPGTDTGFRLCVRVKQTAGTGSPNSKLELIDPTYGFLTSSGNISCSYSSATTVCVDVDPADAANITSAGFAGGWTMNVILWSTGSRDCTLYDAWLEVPDAGGQRRRVTTSSD